MPNATLLDLEVTETEISWTDLTRSLAADAAADLGWFGVYGADGAPAMVECTDCNNDCEGECGCGC